MNKLIKLLILGIGIRAALAPFFMHTWDITTILISSDQFLEGLNPYRYVMDQANQLLETSGLPISYYGFAYLPTTLLLFSPFYALYSLLSMSRIPLVGGHGDIYTSLHMVYPDIFFALVAIKLPIIIADAVIIYLLFKANVKAAWIYALSPYEIVITSLWGNFDPIIGLMLLASYLAFNKNKLLSGLLYGLSLMKMYTIVCLPAFIIHLYKKPKQLMSFFIGLSITQLPCLFYLFKDTQSFLYVMLFQASRPTNGVNIYYSVIEVGSLEHVLLITKAISIIFIIALAITTIKLARVNIELKEFITALMLTYIIFAPVMNEQFLAALLPIGMLSKNFTHKLTLFPLLYIAFNSTYHYFAIPIFFANQELRAIWDGVNLLWGKMIADYRFQLRYLFGVGMGLSAFWLLRTTFVKAKVRITLNLDFHNILS